jgi:hypothetical protein
MSVALPIMEALQAADVPADKARELASAVSKALEEGFVTKADHKQSHSDVLHVLSTQANDVMNHLALHESRLTHRIDQLYLKVTVTMGGIVITALGVLFGLIKAFT